MTRSSPPLLSIAIPTYNRSMYLSRLLTSLCKEIVGYESLIEVIISNNGSTDETSEVIERYIAKNLFVTAIHHPVNGGMDFNFLACFQQVRGRYFWILSDDDLPLPGFIPKLLQLLTLESPDLLYLRSIWLPFSEESRPLDFPRKLNYQVVPRSLFASSVHVWITFLSGMIVRLNRDTIAPDCFSSLEGTKLLQLSWVLERLKNGSKFIITKAPCISATSGNTGGYSVLKVFGSFFPTIVKRMLLDSPEMSKVANAIICRARLFYMPSLIIGFRKKVIGDFEYSEVENNLLGDKHRFSLDALLLIPIARLSIHAAFVWYGLLFVTTYPLLVFDKFRLHARPVKFIL